MEKDVELRTENELRVLQGRSNSHSRLHLFFDLLFVFEFYLLDFFLNKVIGFRWKCFAASLLKEVLKETTLTAHSVNYNGDANNRTFVPIKLPKNTVSFVYSVSSNYADNTSPTLRLLADLVERYDPTHGLLADIVNSLDDPVGTADCSIYLIKDNENLDKFNDKNFNFQYFPEGTRKGIKSGIVEVELDEPLPENVQWYLGIENPDSKNDIYVTIEVCALVFHE